MGPDQNELTFHPRCLDHLAQGLMQSREISKGAIPPGLPQQSLGILVAPVQVVPTQDDDGPALVLTQPRAAFLVVLPLRRTMERLSVVLRREPLPRQSHVEIEPTTTRCGHGDLALRAR